MITHGADDPRTVLDIEPACVRVLDGEAEDVLLDHGKDAAQSGEDHAEVRHGDRGSTPFRSSRSARWHARRARGGRARSRRPGRRRRSAPASTWRGARGALARSTRRSARRTRRSRSRAGRRRPREGHRTRGRWVRRSGSLAWRGWRPPGRRRWRPGSRRALAPASPPRATGRLRCDRSRDRAWIWPAPRAGRGRSGPVGLQNVDTSHAALRWYSWMSPPRTSRRRTLVRGAVSGPNPGSGG